jgi:acyl-[acyl-carrier-protein]-phospholipid O-acyltransferase/long-chain-fatty-acid--[acyl-carrier-protein] ligase
MYRNQFSLLTTNRFLPLVITQFLGSFNDNLFKNALVILITYRMAERFGVNTQVLVVIAGTLLIFPFFIFSATAGQLADKYDKAWLSRWIKFAEIILMSAAAFGFYLDNIYFLLTVLFLMGAQSAFFGPIKYGILPDHLAEDELVSGNALIETTTFLAILTGAMLGGLIVLEANGVLLISIFIVAVAIAGWIASLFIPATQPAVPKLIVGYNIFYETWRVVNYARQDKIVFLCVLGTSWFWMLGGNFLSMFPALGKDIIGANEQVVTLFLLSFSLGVTTGSLLCNSLLRGEIHAGYVPLGALGLTIFMADAYFAAFAFTPKIGQLINIQEFFAMPSSWRLLFSLTMVAVFGGIYIVPLYALLQQQSDPKHRARNIAANNIVNALFIVLGGIGCATLLKYGVSVPQIFLIMAILNIFVIAFTDRLLPGALARILLTGLLWLLYRVDVQGTENLKIDGKRILIVPNHLSFLDAVLIAAYIRTPLTFAIDTHVAQQWWIRIFLKISASSTHRIDPTNPLALRTLVACLKRGEQVVIFPEGRITVTGGLMKIYDGPALVAEKADAMLLPVHLDGPQYTNWARLQGKVRQMWFPKISINFLPPQRLNIPNNLRGRARRHYAGNQLYDLMSNAALASVNSRRTLFQSLLDATKLHGATHLIVEDINQVPMSYRQLITASFVLGQKMATITAKNEHVGLLLPNAIAAVVGFFALHAYGRIPAMINFSTGSANALTSCRTAQIRTIFTARKFIETAKLIAFIQELETAGMQIKYLEDIKSEITSMNKLYGLLAGFIPNLVYKFTCQHFDSQTPAVILFTSGTEGFPKGVALSHHNLQINRYQVAARLDFTPKDRVFNALPLFHSFGLSTGTLLPMLFGIRVFLYPSPLHYRIIPEMLYTTNATILFSTDTFLTGYARHAHPYDLYNLRLVFSGAERLKDETRRMYSQQFGIRILEGYGVTETSPVLAVNTPMHHRQGTVGRLLPGLEWKIESVPGIVEGGKLLVKGANVMLGYLKADNPGVLQPPQDGWYDTGDIVTVDADGYVAIKGRLKRFAKIGGEMVSLAAIEAHLARLWPNYVHAVINLPDAKKGEKLVLVTNYQQAQREELIAFARDEGLAEISIPKILIKLSELPILGAGKLDYGKIRTILQNFTSDIKN